MAWFVCGVVLYDLPTFGGYHDAILRAVGRAGSRD